MTKAALSNERKHLIELMQETNYGRIERLEVRNGEPVFDPPPTVLQLYLFGKDNGPNTALSKDDFEVKEKVKKLFDLFDRECTFTIQELIIDNGLPARMMVTGMVRV
jgi:hypothetical protein